MKKTGKNRFEMDSEYFSKGYLLSSTPVQSEDSGYFGSGSRRNKLNENVSSSCSPIKESAFKNVAETFPFHHELSDISPQFNKNLHVSSLKKDSLCGFEINDLPEFEFTSSNFSDQNELYKGNSSISMQKLCDTESSAFYSSLSEDKDIKYKLFEFESNDLISTDDSEYSKNSPGKSLSPKEYAMKCRTLNQTKVDFIHELKVRNCSSIIACMLSYLSAKELCIASCVSNEWNKVILDDYRAKTRKETFITERALFLNGPSKENRLGMRFGPTEHKKAFSDLTNIVNSAVHLPVAVKSKISSTKFDSFIQEARKEQRLLKCPKCCYASKYLDGNKCVCTHCSYRFCSNCLSPILKSHSCLKPKLPNIIVGSKKSKKNLRRL